MAAPADILRDLLMKASNDQDAAFDGCPPPPVNPGQLPPLPPLPPPANFTTQVPFDNENYSYRNWDSQVNLPNVYIYKPVSVDQCVFLANDAKAKGFKLRPVGQMHNWSPLAVNANAGPNPGNIYFVNTVNLSGAAFQMDGDIPTATFGTGVTVQCALEFLKTCVTAAAPQGYSFVNFTGPGEISLGGALAIGAHGTSVYSQANPDVNNLYGCLSNLVRSFTAIVTPPGGNGAYVLKTFSRGDTDAAAFLVHLGRAFITEVTMQVVPNYFVELTSWYPDISIAFEAPAATQSAESVQTFVETYGRVEVLYFPYTNNAWVKTWKQVPAFTQNPVTSPYPLKFANDITQPLSDIVQGLFRDFKDATPLLMGVFLDISRTAPHGKEGYVMSGLAKDLLLYVETNTLRITCVGYAIQIKRADIQKTVNTFFNYFNPHLKVFNQTFGFYPVNAPVEIRFTGLDDPALLNIPGAEPPLLSAASPMSGDPDVDTVFWIDILSMPLTAGMAQFFIDLETFIHVTWPGAARPEWSKGWAFSTANIAWDPTSVVITKRIPDAYSYNNAMARAQQTLDSYDQGSIYYSPLLQKLMP